jgi:CRP-like cAMP-binding protein
MTIEDDIGFFERVPTLALLGREALRILAIGAENRYVHSGSPLLLQGEIADAAYVVQEGSFRLTREGEDEAEALVVGPGVIIHELALLIEMKCRVTATASQPSTVIRIPRSLFLKMLEGYPDAAARLREKLLSRNEQVTREVRQVRGKLGGADGPAGGR